MPTICEDAHRAATKQLEDARRLYIELAYRNEKPQDGDAERLLATLKTLGHSLSDFHTDSRIASRFAEVERLIAEAVPREARAITALATARAREAKCRADHPAAFAPAEYRTPDDAKDRAAVEAAVQATRAATDELADAQSSRILLHRERDSLWANNARVFGRFD